MEKINSIAIFGAPYSGKSTLLEPYKEKVFYMGDYLRNLNPLSKLGKFINPYVKVGQPLPRELFRRVINEIEFDESKYLLFDGTPRSLDQLEIMSDRFNFIEGIEILVSESVWLERIKLAQFTRNDREDATTENLINRNITHVSEMKLIKPNFYNWSTIDNSFNIELSELLLCEKLKKYF